MITEQPEFVQFLVKAKQNTYASGAQPSSSARLGAHDLAFEEGPFRYGDSYFGGELFIGAEVVWQADVPVWAMNYYGRLLAEEAPEGLGEFLKEALCLVAPDTPYRGPRTYRRDPFEYRCLVVGKLHAFSGGEEIILGGTKIYELVFHGGLVR
jgi:hypothetical protein